MNINKLLNLVDNSDLNYLQKSITKGFLERAQTDYNSEILANQLVKDLAHLKNIKFEIVFRSEEMIMYKILNQKHSTLGDKQYLFNTVYKNVNNKWISPLNYCECQDIALLYYLQDKYLGAMSDIAEFAAKGLGINHTKLTS